MYVKTVCKTCGEIEILNIRVHLDVFINNTELNKIEIIETLDEIEFLKQIEPHIKQHLSFGIVNGTLLKELRDLGLSEIYALELIEAIKINNRLYPGGELLGLTT